MTFRAVGVALLLAACTGAVDEADDPSTGSASAVSTSADAADPGTSTTTVLGTTANTRPRPTVAPTSSAESCVGETVAAMRQCWARNRERVADRLAAGIASDGWGIGDDNILRGPGGMEIDLTGCPGEWSDTAGVTEDSIRLVMSAPLSGGLGFYTWHEGTETYLQVINDSGGVGGRRLELEILDHGFQARAVVDAIDAGALSNPPALGFITSDVGATFSVADGLDAACVPMPQALVSHPAAADGDRFGWMNPGLLSYRTEAVLMLDVVEELTAKEHPVSIAAVQMDTFGRGWGDALIEEAGRRPETIGSLTLVEHEPNWTDGDAIARMEEVAALEPDAVLQLTAGHPCLQGLTGAGSVGLLGDLDNRGGIFMNPSLCTSAPSFLTPAGRLGHGVVALRTPFVQGFETELAGGVFAQWVDSILGAAGVDPTLGYNRFGVAHAWVLVEALRIADALPGGLTRTNLALAQAALDLDHPALPAGIAFKTNGFDDRFPIEGAVLARYDAELGDWESIVTLDADGRTAPCRWQGPVDIVFQWTGDPDNNGRNLLWAPCY